MSEQHGPSSAGDPAPTRQEARREGWLPVHVVEAGKWENDEGDRVSVLQIADGLLKHWKLIFALPTGFAALAVILVLIMRPKYMASASFVPESESASINLPSGLAGVAAQFGLGLPGPANPASFYGELLESQAIRDSILRARFLDPVTRHRGDSAQLLDLLEITGDSPVERLEIGRKRLRSAVSVSVDPQTNIVRISVETWYPALSAAVANRFLDYINDFNLRTRQTVAGARRRFIEARLEDAERELRVVEENLQSFLQRNRSFDQSPDLQFEYERLQRQIRINEEIATTLRREYEQARIQEVNDTPVITVIDQAAPPAEKSSPRRRLTVIAAFLLGGILALSLTFAREYLERVREDNPEQFANVSERLAAARRRISSLVRRKG